MDLYEISCEGGRWLELCQEHTHWLHLFIIMLNLQVVLLKNGYFSSSEFVLFIKVHF
jgi:hypothetical protein